MVELALLIQLEKVFGLLPTLGLIAVAVGDQADAVVADDLDLVVAWWPSTTRVLRKRVPAPDYR